MFAFGRHLQGKLIGQWLLTVASKVLLPSSTHTEQRQPRSMAEDLGADVVEECKGSSPPSVPTTNVAANKNPIVSSTIFTADVRY